MCTMLISSSIIKVNNFKYFSNIAYKFNMKFNNVITWFFDKCRVFLLPFTVMLVNIMYVCRHTIPLKCNATLTHESWFAHNRVIANFTREFSSCKKRDEYLWVKWVSCPFTYGSGKYKGSRGLLTPSSWPPPKILVYQDWETCYSNKAGTVFSSGIIHSL